MSIPSRPPYKRQVWEYSKANTNEIQTSLNSTDRESKFAGLTVDQMTNEFTTFVMDLMTRFIPSKYTKCDDKDPPWITPETKTAIKHKHRVCNKCVKRGCKPDEWEHVIMVHNKTSAMITNAEDNYFTFLGRKLSKPATGWKAYWTTLNKIINKKR